MYNEQIRKAQRKYQAKCRAFTLRINKTKEPDVVAWLEDTANITEYITQLVKEDMERYEK